MSRLDQIRNRPASFKHGPVRRFQQKSVKEVRCFVCPENIGDEPFEQITNFSRYDRVYFIHTRCARSEEGRHIMERRISEIDWIFFASKYYEKIEAEGTCDNGCLRHSMPWEGPPNSWGCSKCREEYHRRMEELDVLGQEQAEINARRDAERERTQPPPFPWKLRPSRDPHWYPTIKMCAEFLREFAARNHLVKGSGYSPYAPGDYDSWGIIVRAYEDQNY